MFLDGRQVLLAEIPRCWLHASCKYVSVYYMGWL